jgi:hypothetical protein
MGKRHKETQLMVKSLVASLGSMLRAIIWKVIRAGALGLVIGIVFIELLAAFLNKTAGKHGFVSFHIWPPAFNTDVFTEFVHISAILFGLLLAIALILAGILVEAIRALLFAANHVDDAAKAALSRMLGLPGAPANAVEEPRQ